MKGRRVAERKHHRSTSRQKAREVKAVDQMWARHARWDGRPSKAERAQEEERGAKQSGRALLEGRAAALRTRGWCRWSCWPAGAPRPQP